MSEENFQSGEHEGQGGFEREDLGSRPVFGFLISLAVLGVLVYFVADGVYGFLDHYMRAHQVQQSPLRPALETDTRDTEAAKVAGRISQTFPEPRLENDERNELTGFRLREEERLNSYGWVDQPAGTVHIPIERAMQLVAERGLPMAPAPSSPAATKGTEVEKGKKP
jgi:hypothetical protein